MLICSYVTCKENSEMAISLITAIFVAFADPWIGIVIGLLLCFVLIDKPKPEKDIV